MTLTDVPRSNVNMSIECQQATSCVSALIICVLSVTIDAKLEYLEELICVLSVTIDAKFQYLEELICVLSVTIDAKLQYLEECSHMVHN